MRIANVLVALLALAALPHADARTLEQVVYLHDASGLHLTPATISAKVGDTVKLTVVNEGESDHNLRVCGDASSPMQACNDIWGFTPTLPPGESAPLVVAVKKAGTFDYYCSIPGHKGSSPGAVGGMWGTLVVQGEEKPAPAAPLALALAGLAAIALASRRLRR